MKMTRLKILLYSKNLKVKKIFLGVTGVALIFIIYFWQCSGTLFDQKRHSEAMALEVKSGKYLINTATCQIPDFDAFSESIMKFIQKEEYTNCTNLTLLTYINRSSNGRVILNINTSLLRQYDVLDVNCCYSEIHRVRGNDNIIRFTHCEYFKKHAILNHAFVKVACHDSLNKSVYENVHATALLDNQYISDLKDNSDFSVLMVGIDGISKQNLRRAMPKTHAYLEKHFVNMKGYNKVGENTYPNLMALLTGQDMIQLRNSCPFSVYLRNKNLEEILKTCSFIWKEFSRSGYLTAFAEDGTPFSTFNFAKRGFFDQPTDYYYRPYFIAAEQLPSVQSSCHITFCTGPENTGERIFNSAKDFSIAFKNQPSFGLFWTNTFSHNNINCPSVMDDKIVQFLSDPSFLNSLNRTIFVFLSDHGFRFGKTRHSYSGWLEERLPFVYMRVPEEFQRQFPKEYGNILINSHRLTTPYDLYNTLRHLLKLHEQTATFQRSLGCPNCRSLFENISENRTCEEAGVAINWCTCIYYQRIPTTHYYVEGAAPFIVAEINSLVDRFSEGEACAEFSLHSVYAAGISPHFISAHNEKFAYLLVMIKTAPYVMFEAIVKVSLTFVHNYRIMGNVSRIDWYGDHISCVKNVELQRYCYCPDPKKAWWD